MRMNYKKRLWPMLALLPVFALAAALSFGLVGLNPPAANAQTVPAVTQTPSVAGEKCGIEIPDEGTNSWAFPDPAVVLAGGPCATSGNSVTVEITNLDTDTVTGTEESPASFAVYVTGGDDIPTAQAGGTGATAYGKLGLDEHRVSLAVPVTDAFGTTNAKKTITVTRSMAKDGDVFLLIYLPTTSGIPLDRTATPPVLPTTGFVKIIKVEFLGPPVLKLADTTSNASTVVVEDAMNTTSGHDEVVVSAQGEATVTLTLRDVNNKPVSGAATLEVGGGPDVQFVGSNLKTRVISVGATGEVEETIRGIPRTGALRIPVDATVGTLELSTYYMTRAGDEAASVSVMGYLCTYDGGTDDLEDQDHCVDEKTALGNTNTGDDPDSLSVVAPGSWILLAGNAADAEGNKSQAQPLDLKWSAADASVLNVDDTSDVLFDDGNGPNDLDTEVLQVADNATLGEYTIMVEDVGEDVTPAASVTFTVTGDASQLEITGPDIINPVTGLATYTVTATDRNGNLPTDVLDNPATAAPGDGIRVNVIVRTFGNPTVTGLKADGTLNFDNSGQATFTIVMPVDTRLGTKVTIVVSGGNLNATKESTYGAVAPALGPATGLTATSNATGTVMLSWTAGPGSTRHFVAGVRKSEHEAGNYANIIWTAASSNSAHTVTGLTDGAVYLFTVISGDATRWSSWHRIVEVTVNPTAGGGGGPGNPFG